MSAAARAWSIVALLVIVIVLCISCYQVGKSSTQVRCDLATTTTALQQTTAIAHANTDMQSAANAVADDSAVRHVQIVTKYQPIETEVIRYVQTPASTTACLDDDGLRLWRAANRGEFDPAEPASAGHDRLPGSAATGIGDGGRSAGQPHAGSEGLSGMQSAPTSPGGARTQGESGL